MGSRTLLLTGLPGTGKTTALRKLADGLVGRCVRGFLTDEIRTRGERVGFRLQSFDGQTVTLAHVGLASPHRVGRYRVDVDALDGLVDRALALDESTDVYIVDEVGKMECFSERFVAAMKTLLESRRPVVASVARHGGGFPAEVRARRDAELWELTWKNRDEMPARIADWLDARLAPGSRP